MKLDDVSICKAIELYAFVFRQFGYAGMDVDEFDKVVPEIAGDDLVLRECTQDEARLLYMDVSLMTLTLEKMLEFCHAGFSRFIDVKSGLYVQALTEGMMGFGIKLLLFGIHAEFDGQRDGYAGLAFGKKDLALVFCRYRHACPELRIPEAARRLASLAAGDVVKRPLDAKAIADNFNLAGWNPGDAAKWN
jgi:hypothetical protein